MVVVAVARVTSAGGGVRGRSTAAMRREIDVVDDDDGLAVCSCGSASPPPFLAPLAPSAGFTTALSAGLLAHNPILDPGQTTDGAPVRGRLRCSLREGESGDVSAERSCAAACLYRYDFGYLGGVFESKEICF